MHIQLPILKSEKTFHNFNDTGYHSQKLNWPFETLQYNGTMYYSHAINSN